MNDYITAIIITLIMALFVWAMFSAAKAMEDSADEDYPWWEEE